MTNFNYKILYSILTVFLLLHLSFAFTGQDVITTTNKDRTTPLVENSTLDLAAQIKADDMAYNNYFSHVSPSGLKFTFWLQVLGYKYKAAGENLAEGFTDIKDMETSLMKSPEHKANIVNPIYQQMGVGITTAKDGTIYVAEEFAKPL